MHQSSEGVAEGAMWSAEEAERARKRSRAENAGEPRSAETATGVAGPRAGSWIESYPRTRMPGAFRGTRVSGCSRSILRVSAGARSSVPAYLCASAFPALCFFPCALCFPRFRVEDSAFSLERQHEAASDTSLLSTSFIEIEVEQVQPKIGSDADGADKPLRP